MAKKIQAAEIVITTTDGGSFKVTGAAAKKLAAEMGALGGASKATDRRIKGVTGQSSNATKNFSKQAQTMQGGIVAVYATIAAQIFAVSAAYQFLKNSFETRNLIEGQQQFGAVTGVAYQTITKNVQEATAGMLQFKEAASGVAIGVAAGLSASALERLGEAAKNASLALGRDVTDSFNRLIRGVTKAEPELLDELGIVLRLENATNKYAVAIGKNREQLNAFERTQAVLNDVLEQAESKYRIIGEVMDPDAFALGQLTKEIDELLMSFQTFIANALTPLIGFFKNNALALVAAMGLFVLPIIRSLLPDLNASLDKSKKKFETASDGMKESMAEMKDAWRGQKMAVADVEGARAGSATGLKTLGVKQFKGGEDQLNARQIAAYKRHMREKTGIYKKFGLQERAAFRRHLLQQEATLNISTKKQGQIVTRGEYVKRAAYQLTTTIVLAAEKAKQAALQMTAKWGMRAMAALGWIGMLAMVVQLGVSAFKAMKNMNEETKRMAEETKKTTEALETLNEELDRMGQVRNAQIGLLNLKMSLEQIGNALQSTDIERQIAAYNKEVAKGTSTNSEVMKQFRAMAYNLYILNPEFATLYNQMKDGENIGVAAIKIWKQLTGGMINASLAAAAFSQNQESLTKSIDTAVGKFAKAPYQELGKNIRASLTGIKDEAGILPSGSEQAKITNTGQLPGLKSGPMAQMLREFQGIQSLSGAVGDERWGISPGKFSSEFGMLAESKVKERNRALQVESAMKTMMAQSLRVDIWSKDEEDIFSQELGGKGSGTTRTGLMKGTGVAAVMKTVEEMETDLGGKMSDSMRSIFDSYVKSYETFAENRSAIAEGEQEDVDAMKMKLETLREQLNISEDIRALQEAGRAIENAKAANKLLLAKNKGLSLENKQTTLLAKAGSAALKETEAGNNVLAANLGIRAAEEKMRTQVLNDEKLLLKANEDLGFTKLQIETMDNKALTSLIEKLNLESDELTNMKNAKGLAESMVLTTTALKDLEHDKLAVQLQALNNARDLAKMMDKAADAARRYKNELRDANRELKVGGNAPSAIGAFRTKKMGLLGGADQTFGEKGFGVGETGGEIGRLRGNAADYMAMAAGVRERIGTEYLKDDAGMDTDVVSKFLFGEEALTGGKGIHNTYIQPATEAQKLFNSYIEKSVGLTDQLNTKVAESVDLNDEMTGANIMGIVKAKKEIANIDRNTIANLNPASQLYWQVVNDAQKNSVTLNAEQLKLLKTSSMEVASLAIETELLNGIQNTLSNGFQSMFQSLIDGTKSFKDSMKDLAKSILADLAAMFLKAAALKMMLAMFPGMGDGSGGFKSLFGGDRYGGIRGPGSFAGGGVAAGPNAGYLAKLHGTEAIVPLGNDRSIPVQLLGSTSNTVNVAVNISGQSSNVSATGGGDAAALGRSIGGLVQQHLQTEMRPGGLLNRQGATGRGG